MRHVEGLSGLGAPCFRAHRQLHDTAHRRRIFCDMRLKNSLMRWLPIWTGLSKQIYTRTKRRPTKELKLYLGVCVPKQWSDHEAHHSGGPRINFDHLGFLNVRLNLTTRAFFTFRLHCNAAAAAGIMWTAGTTKSVGTAKFSWTFCAHSYYLIYYFNTKNKFLWGEIISKQRINDSYAVNICHETVRLKEHWIWHPPIHCDPCWECTRRWQTFLDCRQECRWYSLST